MKKIFIILGILLGLALLFFGYRAWQKNKLSPGDPAGAPNTPGNQSTPRPNTSHPKVGDTVKALSAFSVHDDDGLKYDVKKDETVGSITGDLSDSWKIKLDHWAVSVNVTKTLVTKA